MPSPTDRPIHLVSTPSGLEARYGVPQRTIRKAAEDGRIEARKDVEGDDKAIWLIDIADFERWLAQRPAPGRGRKKSIDK